MNNTAHWLVLTQGETQETFLWLRINARGEPDGAGGEVAVRELDTLAVRYPLDSCCLLVSVSSMAIHRVHLPGRHDAAGMRALPWLLEEKLGAPMQQMAVVPLASEGEHVRAAAMEQAQLERWQAPFQAAGLRLLRIIPDALLLPLHDAAPSALRWRAGWLLRVGRFEGAQVDDDWLSLWLAARRREWPDEGPVRCYGEIPTACPDWQAQPLQDAFSLLAREAVQSGITLLPVAVTRSGYAWRAPLYAAAVALVLLFAWKGLTLWQLVRQGDALEQQVRQQFHSRFPGEGQANWHALVRREMARQSDGDFAGWMAALPALPDGVTVRELDWRAGGAQLRLVLNGEAAKLALAQARLAQDFTLERQRDGAFVLMQKDDAR